MGLDVNLYAEVNPTDAELEAANQFFVARSGFGDAWQKDSEEVLTRDDEEWYDHPRVVVQTMSRYYGQGYERGDWAVTYGAIRVLQAAFPEAKVFYGSDSTDDGLECTDEYLAEMWHHLLGPDGDAYRRPRLTTPPPSATAPHDRPEETR